MPPRLGQLGSRTSLKPKVPAIWGQWREEHDEGRNGIPQAGEGYVQGHLKATGVSHRKDKAGPVVR